MLAQIQTSDEATRASEERFRQLAENIREVFWLTNPDKTEMLYISPAYEKIWRRPCGPLYAAPTTWMDAIHPEDRDRVRQAAATKQTDGSYDEEYRIVCPDGSTRWIRDRAFPISDYEGNVYRIAGLPRTSRSANGCSIKFLKSATANNAASGRTCTTA